TASSSVSNVSPLPSGTVTARIPRDRAGEGEHPAGAGPFGQPVHRAARPARDPEFLGDDRSVVPPGDAPADLDDERAPVAAVQVRSARHRLPLPPLVSEFPHAGRGP